MSSTPLRNVIAVAEGDVGMKSAALIAGPSAAGSFASGPVQVQSDLHTNNDMTGKENSFPDDRSTAIVNFLTPFGVGSNLASVLESDPVALIKFLDKHPSMELYWDENSVLQCVDKNSGKFIDYASVNSAEEQQLIDSPAIKNLVHYEYLQYYFDKAIGRQTIFQPRNYYPDMEALRACLIQESDGSECSMDDCEQDFEDTHMTIGYVNTACNSNYGGRVTRSMARNGRAKV